MANENSSENAVSGGLLVVLGIIVALGAAYIFTQYNGRSSSDVTIRAELPNLPEKQ
jgi:hypothetical protein